MYPSSAYLNSKFCCLVAKSCLTLCDPVDCSSPGSSVHGISRARTLEWVAISSFRGSSRPRDQTCLSCTAGGFLPLSHQGSPWFQILKLIKKIPCMWILNKWLEANIRKYQQLSILGDGAIGVCYIFLSIFITFKFLKSRKKLKFNNDV